MDRICNGRKKQEMIFNLQCGNIGRLYQAAEWQCKVVDNLFLNE